MHPFIRLEIISNSYIGVQPDTFLVRQRVIRMYEAAFGGFKMCFRETVWQTAELQAFGPIEWSGVEGDYSIPAGFYRRGLVVLHDVERAGG